MLRAVVLDPFFDGGPRMPDHVAGLLTALNVAAAETLAAGVQRSPLPA